MKKCPYCAEEIQDEAIVCKHCKSDLRSALPPAPVKPQSQPHKSGISKLSMVLIIIIGSILSCIFIGSSIESMNKPKTATSTMAYVKCERFVTERLKSPASAKFPLPIEVPITTDDNITFTVYGYVDSQNSFGAMIRNNYICTVKFDPPNDRYDLVDLQFTD